MIPGFINPTEEALKTLLEKKEMLVTSIFSFSSNVFHPASNRFQFLIYIACVFLRMILIWTILKFCRLEKS